MQDVCVSFGFFLQWLLTLKEGKKKIIAAFGMEMEEQGMGRGKCACLSFQVWFTLVAKGTPYGNVVLLPICRCAPEIVVTQLYGSISISDWRHSWHSLGWHPPPVVPAGCAAWCALSMSPCPSATHPRDGVHLCPTLHGAQHHDLPPLLQPHPSRPHAVGAVLAHCLTWDTEIPGEDFTWDLFWKSK